MKTRICRLLIPGGLLLAFLLRLAPLGRYVTPDEPAWVYRSIRFAEALAAHNRAAVPSTGHPGVTTMWLGAVGVALSRLLDPATADRHLAWLRPLAWLAPENDAAFRHLAYFLTPGRIAVALVTTGGLLLLYLLLTRLFERRTALIAVGLLAWDPFLVGHSGLLHTDALLATFTVLALTAALIALRERHPGRWAFSGLWAGLAVLTKTPAILLFPFILPLALFKWPPTARWKGVRDAGIFLACALAIPLLLYPAFWADPGGTLADLLSFAGRHVETVQRPIFFAGRMTYDPGPAFYPVVFLFRASPLVLLGLGAGIAGLRRLPPSRRAAFLLLVTFALIFGAGMNLGAKKHDRYLLPIFPPLTIAAALGLARFRWGIFLPAIQLALLLPCAAYPLTGFNPLLGGKWGASHLLATDWGEQAGRAARTLNRLPEAAELTVAAYSVPSCASLFVGHTVPLDRATLADYILPSSSTPLTPTAPLTIPAGPGDLILLDADLPLRHRYDGPATVVSCADLPDEKAIVARLPALNPARPALWLVSDPAAAPITAAQLRDVLNTIGPPVTTATVGSAHVTRYTYRRPPTVTRRSPQATFGPELALVDALLSADDPLTVHLRWTVTAPSDTDFHALVYLRDDAGHLWADVGQIILNAFTYPTSAWPPGSWGDMMLRFTLPAGIPPGEYAVQLTVADGVGAQRGAWDATGRFLGVRVPLGTVTVPPPAQPVGPLPCGGRTAEWEGFRACLPSRTTWSVPSGDLLTLPVTWCATTAPTADRRVTWRLLSPDAGPAPEQTHPLSPYPTTQWREDDCFRSRYDLRLDPTLPPGTYTLTLTLDGLAVPVAGIEILPRERFFDLPDDITHPLDMTVGDFIHLRGFDLRRTVATPGGTVPLTLYWQADGPADLDYTVFVHLLGSDGLPHGQSDRPPGGEGTPTTSLAPGQVLVDTISLPVAADAPPGTYHIAVGLYDPLGGGRLPIIAANGHLLPDDRFLLPVEITVE